MGGSVGGPLRCGLVRRGVDGRGVELSGRGSGTGMGTGMGTEPAAENRFAGAPCRLQAGPRNPRIRPADLEPQQTTRLLGVGAVRRRVARLRQRRAAARVEERARHRARERPADEALADAALAVEVGTVADLGALDDAVAALEAVAGVVLATAGARQVAAPEALADAGSPRRGRRRRNPPMPRRSRCRTRNIRSDRSPDSRRCTRASRRRSPPTRSSPRRGRRRRTARRRPTTSLPHPSVDVVDPAVTSSSSSSSPTESSSSSSPTESSSSSSPTESSSSSPTESSSSSSPAVPLAVSSSSPSVADAVAVMPLVTISPTESGEPLVPGSAGAPNSLAPTPVAAGHAVSDRSAAIHPARAVPAIQSPTAGTPAIASR